MSLWVSEATHRGTEANAGNLLQMFSTDDNKEAVDAFVGAHNKAGRTLPDGHQPFVGAEGLVKKYLYLPFYGEKILSTPKMPLIRLPHTIPYRQAFHCFWGDCVFCNLQVNDQI